MQEFDCVVAAKGSGGSAASFKSDMTRHTVDVCRMGSGDKAFIDRKLHFLGVSGFPIADTTDIARINGEFTSPQTIMIGENALI